MCKLALRPSYTPEISYGARKVHNVPAIKVLIVDQAGTGAALREALDNESAIIVVGAASQDQLDNVDPCELRPDVLILRLVDLHGLELLHGIRSGYCWLRMVVVVPQADAGFLYRALQAGAQGIISYRLAGKTLGDAVRAVHAGGTFISGEVSAALLNDYLGLRNGADRTSPLQRLSQRERQVFDLVLGGKTSTQIAQQLAISPKSVDTYRGRLMSKFGVSNVTGLLHFAEENGLTQGVIP